MLGLRKDDILGNLLDAGLALVLLPFLEFQGVCKSLGLRFRAQNLRRRMDAGRYCDNLLKIPKQCLNLGDETGQQGHSKKSN